MAFETEQDRAWADIELHLQGLNEVEFNGQTVTIADLRIILDNWPTPKLQELYNTAMRSEHLPFIRPYIKNRLVQETMLKLRVMEDNS